MLDRHIWLRRRVFDFHAAGNNVRPFGFLRIGLSSVLLAKLLYELPDFGDLYGPHGLIPWWTNELAAPNHVPTLGGLWSALSSHGIAIGPEAVAVGMVGLYAGALVLLLTGYWERIAAPVVWLTHFVFFASNRSTLYGTDAFVNIGLFCIVLGPPTRLNSLQTHEHRQQHYGFRTFVVASLLRVQLCIAYFEAGWAKASFRGWWTGDELWKALQQPQFHGMIGTDRLGEFPLLVSAIGISVILTEIAYPLAMWIRHVRVVELASILTLHTVIILTLGLWTFGATMIVLNCAAFGIPTIGELRSVLPRPAGRHSRTWTRKLAL